MDLTNGMSREIWGCCGRSLLHFPCSEIPKNNSYWIKTLPYALGSSASYLSLPISAIIMILTGQPSDSACQSLLLRQHSILFSWNNMPPSKYQINSLPLFKTSKTDSKLCSPWNLSILALPNLKNKFIEYSWFTALC